MTCQPSFATQTKTWERQEKGWRMGVIHPFPNTDISSIKCTLYCLLTFLPFNYRFWHDEEVSTPHCHICYVYHSPPWTFTTSSPTRNARWASTWQEGIFLLLCRVLAILTWQEGISLSSHRVLAILTWQEEYPLSLRRVPSNSVQQEGISLSSCRVPSNFIRKKVEW